MKFISPLSPEQQQMLREMMTYHPNVRCRRRAHSLLLSNRGYTIRQIADIFEVERRAISSCIDQWEAKGVMGVYDQPRSGRPTLFTPAEAALLPDWVAQEPRQLKQAIARLNEKTGKTASYSTCVRILKNSSGFGSAVGTP
jgi:transposase